MWFDLHDINKRVRYHLRMRQLGVIRDKQTFSAAVVVEREEYFICSHSPGMFLFIPCLSRMTPEISHGSLLTARFRTRLLTFAVPSLCYNSQCSVHVFLGGCQNLWENNVSHRVYTTQNSKLNEQKQL